MPPKRKPEAVPEPSPPPKKRSAKPAPSSDKKRAREEAPEGSSKGRRTKKAVEEEEEEEREAPSTPVVTTATKAKRGSKVAPTTPQTKGKATPPPSMPKSALKTTNSKPRARKSVVHMELPPEVSSAKKSSSTPEAKAAPATSPKSSRRSAHVTEVPTEASHEASSSSDEVEITSLWNQTWGALHMCLTTIGPLFFAVVMLCYFVGTLQQSQAIASVGVVYTLLFITIMGSYTLVILPCILIARLFTCIVSPHAPCHTPEEINLYSRLLVLIGVAAGLTYHFVSHHA